MNKEKLRKQADWSSLVKRPTWGTLTSMELSKVLGVTIVDIGNWKLRGKLPAPEPRPKGKGNKNRYKISKIRAWLESRSEDEIHWEFINTHMSDEFKSIEQAIWNAKNYWRAFEIEKSL